MPNRLKKVVEELEELSTKILELDSFIVSEEFRSLETLDKKLLNKQYGVMLRYKKVLKDRINRFKTTN